MVETEVEEQKNFSEYAVLNYLNALSIWKVKWNLKGVKLRLGNKLRNSS